MAEYFSLLQKLIQFQTTRDKPREIERCFLEIIRYFNNTPFRVQRFSKNKITSLVIGLPSVKSPDIFLVGHIDVVPASKTQFVPKIRGKNLYARGAFDMKALVAMMMYVLKNSTFSSEAPTISLMITSDEEHAGENGVGYLLNQKQYRSKVAIIPDGGDDFQLVREAKGVIKVILNARGKSSHSSRPWEGKNAIEFFSLFYQKLLQKFPVPKSMNDWKTSIALTKIFGGTTTNQIPEFVQVVFDIRYIQKDSPQTLIKKILELGKPFHVSINDVKIFPPIVSPLNNIYLKQWKRCAKKVLKRKMSSIHYSGSCDAKYFSQKNIPVIITKPKGGDIHGPNEWIDLTSLKKFHTLLLEFLNTFPRA